MDPKIKTALAVAAGVVIGMLVLGTAFAVPAMFHAARVHTFATSVAADEQGYGNGYGMMGQNQSQGYGMMGQDRRQFQGDGRGPGMMGGQGYGGMRGQGGCGVQGERGLQPDGTCPNVDADGTCPNGTTCPNLTAPTQP